MSESAYEVFGSLGRRNEAQARDARAAGSSPFPPAAYLRLNISIIGVLFLLNGLAAYVMNTDQGAPLARACEFFLLDAEKNLPTMFNFGIILMNVILLGLISNRAFAEGERWRWHWTLLCLIFMFLSYDEAAQVHERFTEIGRQMVGSSGIFRFAWFVPIAPIVLVVGIGFLRFVLNQARGVAVLMVLSGVIFISGTIGFEMVGGAYVNAYDAYGTLPYFIISGVEEVLEMFGMALFGYTLLLILRSPVSRPANAATAV
jgi:hypothetical protein